MFLLNLIPAYFFNRYLENRREAEMYRQRAQLMSKYKTDAHVNHKYYKQNHLIKDLLWEWNETETESMLISILKQDRVLSKMNIVPFKTIKDEDNYFLIEGPTENKQEVVIRFRILESSETASSILRINWLISNVHVLPYIWYDKNGDPYVTSYGGAAIRAV